MSEIPHLGVDIVLCAMFAGGWFLYFILRMVGKPALVKYVGDLSTEVYPKVQVLDESKPKVPESTALDSILNPSRKYRFKETS